MEAAERLLLTETVRDAVTLAAPSGPTAVDGVLAELGWLEMLAAEPTDAIAIVFRALGDANATATALDDVVAFALGLEPRADLAVLLPPFASWDPPGRVEAGSVRARGLATARATAAGEMLIVCDAGAELRAVIVPASSTAPAAVQGIDADAGLHIASVDAAARAAAPVATFAREQWDTAVALSQRAVAHQIEGATRAMLALARLHALDRVQFGRPVARFQAVRHRLAEALVAIESLDAALIAAADAPGPETAALAKAVAGRTARTVAGHSQQVLAGIGFTTDHPFHRYLKRTMLLDGLFGAADAVVVAIGHRLLASRTVPTLIEL